MVQNVVILAFGCLIYLTASGQTNRQKTAGKSVVAIDLLEKEDLTLDDLKDYEENNIYYYSKGPHYNIQLGLRLLSVSDDPFYLQHVHSQVAGAYRDLGMTSNAIEHQMKCVQYAIELNDKIAEGYARIQLGNLYYDQKNWKRAAGFYEESIEISEAIDHPHMKTVSLNNLGMIQEAISNYSEALKLYQQSLEIRRLPTGSRDGVAHSYTHIGQAFALLGERDSALSYLNKALLNYSSLSSGLGMINTYERLGKAYKGWGDYKGALTAYKEGLSLAREEKIYMREADLLLNMAEIYELQGNEDALVTSLLAIPEVADRINYLTILPKAYEALYSHYRDQGNFEKALYHHELLEEALDKLENQTAAVDLAEAETKLREIVQQKDLQFEQRKRERATLIAISVILLLIISAAFGATVYRKNRFLKKVNHQIEAQKKEIQNQNEALEKALSQAETSMLAKSQFLSRMSHEIRTPMNAIVGLTDVILEHNESHPEVKKNAQAIAQSAEHLLSLINEVLEFSRMESKEFELISKPFNLARLIDNIYQINVHRAASQGNDWNVDIDAELHSWYLADSAKINEVLVNLVGNAQKFCKKGKVNLKVECLRHDAEADRVRFSVCDTGIGIPQDKQKDIFQEFVQASEEVHLEYGGTGLGLSISDRIIKAMGGQIELKSKPNEGATFTFTLDLKRTESIGETNLEVNPESLSGSILLVEDDAMNQLVFKQLVSKTKCQLDIAENGQIGYEKACEKKYDIIFMDLQMPKMNGFESAHSIRRKQDSMNQRTPIIAFSADVFEERQKKARAVGMNEFLMKPARQTDLYRALAQYLQVSVIS